MGLPLSDLARRLLDADTFGVLATANRDGSPQSSVIWAKRDGDEVVFSTILGRLKTRNMERSPQVSLCLYDPDNPYRYVELRGPVSITQDGGPELIQELSQRYEGRPFVESDPANVRVVCRLTRDPH
jgi:PPOX class probable F420-dependent enzyme